MRDLPAFDDPNLLIGAQTLSDAGVYRLRDDLAIVQSVDFFAPLVDDPFAFGQIAASNALSDLYAMGATPRTCLNIVGFPDKELPIEILGEILRGASERVACAGAVVVGGHSVRDGEIKFGLSVTGVIDPRSMMTNEGARAGDTLVLTKALGTGVITTALRKDRCPQDTLPGAIESMIRLNADAARIAMELGVRGATDITGFGLLGHARELALGSAVTIEIDAGALPILPGAIDLATSENRSSASTTNREAVEGDLRLSPGVDPALVELMFDPQTSGGLLLAIDADRAHELVRRLRGAGDAPAAIIGRVLGKGSTALVVA